MADYHVKRALSIPKLLNKTNIVRMKGLEPPRLSAPDPKSGTATNYATSASILICFNFKNGVQRQRKK